MPRGRLGTGGNTDVHQNDLYLCMMSDGIGGAKVTLHLQLFEEQCQPAA